ncbi:MAG: hypothetical protein HXY38_07365 [Chloroflexi bacterium]|nr:hypothetical protein [Chloroflexota bacterium]
MLIALLACIAISTGSLAWGYRNAGNETISAWIILFGVCWLLAIWRKWRWVPSLAVLAALLLAAFGIWFELGNGWMFNGVIFALLAWNLSEFERTLKLLPAREDIPGRTRRHVLRISLLALMGFVIEALFLLARGEFSPAWGIFALGVTFLGSFQFFFWRR